MDISNTLATNILYKMKDIIHQDLNYINTEGIIIASTDPKRVGTFHEASLRCVKKGEKVIIETDEQYIGSRKGINMPIYFDESIIGVIGITGDKEEVEKFGEIIRMMTGILIKEAWIKDQDIRKQEITKAFIERIALEYEHDFFPMANFIFPYSVIVGKTDNQNLFFSDNDIISILKDFLSYNIHNFYTVSRNEIIILYHNNDIENIENDLLTIQKNLEKKKSIIFKFSIGPIATNYYELKNSYKIAKEILSLSSFSNKSKEILDYNKIDLELLFLSLKKQNIELFIKKILNNFSQKEIVEFSTLLSIYEKNNGSITKTSESLFMHKNTLQYKLNKIKKLSGYDPRNLKDFTVLSLAFKLNNIK